MVSYLIRRFFYMILTLFGIAVITFGITRIAPGDPASLKLQAMMTSPKSQPISKKMLEENRKLYGFDKPMFLNFQKKGKSAYIPQLIENYLSENETYFKEQYWNELSSLNTLALPYLFEALQKNNENIEKEKKTKILGLIQESLGLENSKEAMSLNQLLEMYEKVKSQFDPKLLNSYADDFIYKKHLFRKNNFLLAKAAAVPILIERVLIQERKRKEMIEILASITGKPWSYNDAMPEKEKRELLYYISNFWEYNKEKYVDFSGFENLIRTFTDTQFGIWMTKILTLDFDTSYAHKRPVIDLIKERLPVTLQLNLISIFLIYLFALWTGVYAATIHNTFKERILTVFLFVLYSLPAFWVANLLIMFLTGGDFLNIFPSQYLHSPDAEKLSTIEYILDWLWHLCLPVLVLTYEGIAFLSRQMKASMLEVLQQDYIRTAYAKGLSPQKVIKSHAFRNALIPIITLLGGLLPAMLGGSVIVEEIFTINGMGKLSFEAIMNRDYPVINAIAFLSAFLTLVGIFISDILYVIVDPRIKLQKEEM